MRDVRDRAELALESVEGRGVETWQRLQGDPNIALLIERLVDHAEGAGTQSTPYRKARRSFKIWLCQLRHEPNNCRYSGIEEIPSHVLRQTSRIVREHCGLEVGSVAELHGERRFVCSIKNVARADVSSACTMSSPCRRSAEPNGSAEQRGIRQRSQETMTRQRGPVLSRELHRVPRDALAIPAKGL